jgi:hypothetical protein
MFKFNPHLLSHASCNFNARLNHQKFVPFGWRVTLLDQKKKRRGAENRGNVYFKKNAGWTSFVLIMFPTVSDRFPLLPAVSFCLND